MSSSNNAYTTPRDIDTNWIQDVVAHIGNAGQPNGSLLNCTCAVCLESTLDISACVGDMIRDELASANLVGSRREFYEKYKLERTAFLRCGHVFGLECLIRFEPDQIGVCPMCRYKSCDGCKRRFEAVLLKDLVPWPLSTAQYQPPLPKFWDSVPLTATEIAPGTKRFCADCMQKQCIREWYRLATLFPKCPACDADRNGGEGGGAAVQYPANHRAWRDANVDAWIHQQLSRVAEALYPSSVDIRDPNRRHLDDPIVNTQRRAFVTRFMADPDLVGPLRRALFLPCEQEEEEPAPLSPAELESIDRSETRAYAEGTSQYMRSGLTWFRGIDDQFRAPPADAAPRDPSFPRQMLAEIVGVDTFEEALSHVNPMVLPSYLDSLRGGEEEE
ncbi:hypothetical protein PG984_013124 [Apiospora sp. TS-2023a]